MARKLRNSLPAEAGPDKLVRWVYRLVNAQDRPKPGGQVMPQYVFPSEKDAYANRPPEYRTNRYYLYRVTMPGKTDALYVWERTPTQAAGRAAEQWGISVEVHQPVPVDRLAEAFNAMSPDEQAKFLAQVQETLRHKGKS